MSVLSGVTKSGKAAFVAYIPFLGTFSYLYNKEYDCNLAQSSIQGIVFTCGSFTALVYCLNVKQNSTTFRKEMFPFFLYGASKTEIIVGRAVIMSGA